MRVFICLSIFSFMVATCQEKCFLDPLSPSPKDGKVVKRNICIDRFDGKTHPIRSRWKTADCFFCECRNDGMKCCQRSVRTVLVERCKEGENPKSCKGGAARLDDKCRLILPMDNIIVHIVNGKKPEYIAHLPY